METLGLLVRIWLWISLPMAAIILLVATYFNYLRHTRPKMGLRLAMEGWGGEGGPVAGAGEPYIHREDVVGDGDALLESGFASAISSAETPEMEELGATGEETIYRGLLWMKEKYEEYREQADRRFEQLREELGRSEQRYNELLEVMEQNKRRALEIVGVAIPANAEPPAELVDPAAPEGGLPEGGLPVAEPALANQLADLRGQLGVKQRVVDELKSQLLAERLKVEELVAILQTNTQMLRKVIPDLGK